MAFTKGAAAAIAVVAGVAAIAVVFFLLARTPVYAVVHPFQPRFEAVPYGPPVRQRYDVFSPESPTGPLVFYLHGGGWMAGNRSQIHEQLDVRRLLDAGLTVVTVGYRYLRECERDTPDFPLASVHDDIATAYQNVIADADRIGFDPGKVIACGASAGGYSALWLALRDSPVKPAAAVVCKAQVTIDPRLVLGWHPNWTYGSNAAGFRSIFLSPAQEWSRFNGSLDGLESRFDEHCPTRLLSIDDPPVIIFYPQVNMPERGSRPDDPVHSAAHGLIIKERAESIGFDQCHVKMLGASGTANARGQFTDHVLSVAEKLSG
ncbi:MAG: alpha/beta hydrolase [Planctomycetota bacterium]